MLLPLATSARADPSFAFTTLACRDDNRGTLRPGDYVECSLRVLVLLEDAFDVTATIPLPAGATFDPADPRNAQAVPDDATAPTKISYGTQQLGLFNPGFPKQVNFWLRLRGGGVLTPGDVVAMTATLHSTNAPDAPVPLSPSLVVQPPPADLTASTVTCQDAGTPPVRPGDELSCTIALTNA